MLPLLLGACGKEAGWPQTLFPQTARGGWTRASVRDVAVSEAPDPVPRNEVSGLREAVYEGPGKLEARVYRLQDSGVGAMLAQRWRPSADTVFFDAGRYFVVVKWQSADRKALQEFVRDLETSLGPSGSRKQ